jgi:hypothetical protein
MDGQKLNISELPDDELIKLLYEVLGELEARFMYRPVKSGNSENTKTLT